MRRIVVALVAALLMTSLVACGSKPKTDATGVNYSASNCPTSNLETFGPAKIAADLGIMYLAFNKFVYQPFKADHFAKTSEKLKGAAAAGVLYVFAKKVKNHIIYSSTLCPKIGKPVSDLTDKLGNLPSLIKNVATGGASIDALKQGMDSLPALAQGAGLPKLPTSNGVNSITDLAGIQ